MEYSRQVEFDRQLLEVYLVGLHSEVESKLRELRLLRENMKLDHAGSGGARRLVLTCGVR